MFNRVITYIKNIFSFDYNNNTNNYVYKPNKEKYINDELQKWKFNMYTDFPHLTHIPKKRIDIQIDIIKREYAEKYGEE
jgi:hypothetical protein